MRWGLFGDYASNEPALHLPRLGLKFAGQQITQGRLSKF